MSRKRGSGSARSMRSAMDAWQTSVAAATTIAARTPILWTAALTGSPKAVRESRRMVTEKAAAAVQGAMAAGQAWASLWLRLGSGMVRPGDVGRNVSSIMDAAVRPAQRACKANARRLTGGGSKGRRKRRRAG